MANYIEKGKSLLKNKEYLKAIELFQAAIESEETPKDAYLGLAEVYFSLQKDNRGREALFKALALDPYDEQGLKMVQQRCLRKENDSVPSIEMLPPKPPQNASTNIHYSVIPPSVNGTPYYAINFSDGNIIYLKKGSDGFSVVQPGGLWDGFKKPIGSLNIPGYIIVDGEKKPVTEIGPSAFAWCGISKIIIPNTIIEIASRAFANCNLSSMVFPDSLTRIGFRAFENNREIKEIYIPNNVTTLEDFAFSGCVKLEKVHLSEKMDGFGFKSFEKTSISCIDIPVSIREISCSALPANRIIKIILHGEPPAIGKTSIERFWCEKTIAYVPKAFLLQYKYTRFWQEMKLIPY